jgi:condensin-2 complex subunit D3
MYEFMLSKLSDEEKIGVTARLAKEILAEAVSQEGDLSRVCQSRAPEQLQSQELNSAWNVLTDAFYILTTQQLKVGKADNEEDNNLSLEDPNVVPNANRQVTMAKTRLLSKISRKHLIEIVLPIVCQLKTQLQASCSPLLKDLQLYLLDIFRRYKKEAREFLANDPLLLQELEYDARQHAAGVGVQ